MDKNQFKAFCKKEFEARGFKKQKNVFYLTGHDLLCGIDLQKSNYGDIYYVNYYYFIGEFENGTDYPTPYDSDIEERILAMSKTQTVHGKCFLTAMIEYEEYTEEQKKMFNIRPGITGWAQVNGRKAVEWHKRIEMNVWYVENLSFKLDFKIFFMTIFKVFANADNVNTGKTLEKTAEKSEIKESVTK